MVGETLPFLNSYNHEISFMKILPDVTLFGIPKEELDNNKGVSVSINPRMPNTLSEGHSLIQETQDFRR